MVAGPLQALGRHASDIGGEPAEHCGRRFVAVELQRDQAVDEVAEVVLPGIARDFQLGRIAGQVGIGFGLKMPSPRCELISEAVTSAVPASPDMPGKWKSRIGPAVAVTARAAEADARRLPAQQ